MKNNVAILVILIALFFAGWILYSSGTFPFVNENQIEGINEEVVTPGGEEVASGCYVGGCSGQICSDEEGIVSTCEYREEYSCYQTAKCERQASGQCGWTLTPELNMCLSRAQ